MAKILLAEDDIALNESLSEILQIEGHTVATVADGQSAWKLLQVEDFDCLITDYMMPYLNADELIARIEQYPELDHLHIILISGVEVLPRMTMQRVSATLYKPFDIHYVLRIVAQL